MKVVEKLRIDGNENAYMMEDSGTRYPVFEDTLCAGEIFDALISEGYKYCGVPFDFRLNGASILSLPVRDYAPTEDEMQDMFDLAGLPHKTQEELRSALSVDDVTYIKEPPADYTIATREEFLEYLRTVQMMGSAIDFKPINYFVHPSARFTIDEWKSGEFVDYFRIMEDRRCMSYHKFLNLRNWLCEIGMDPNGSEFDIIDMYYSWGIDGISANYVTRTSKLTYILEDVYMQEGMEMDVFEIMRNEYALVDRYGAVIPPKDVEPSPQGWKVALKNGTQSSTFKRKVSALKEYEQGVVPIKTESSERVLVLTTLRDTINITATHIKCGRLTMRNMTVMSPDITAAVLPSYYWSAIHDTKVKEMAELRSLAYEVLRRRKYASDASTYKALTAAGCDIKGAIMYVIDQTLASRADTEDYAEFVKDFPTEAEVDLYLSGDFDEDSLPESIQVRIDVIKEIVSGTLNIDNVAAGATADKSFDVTSVYSYLYAAYFCNDTVTMEMLREVCTHLSDHLVKRADASGETEEFLPIKYGLFTINIPCPEINGKIEGYQADLRRYKVMQADQCCGFLRVVQIAKEFGQPEANDHVAFEADTVNLRKDKKIAERNLERLMEIFEEQLQNVAKNMQPTLRLYKRTTCMREYFRIADTGVMKFSREFGSTTVEVPEDLVLSIRSTITRKITSTAVYCARMYEDKWFTHYCVNADITPYRIYPKKGYKIPMANLVALWYDLSAMGASAIVANLTSAGYIYPGFIPWTLRYTTDAYFSTEKMPKETDLTRYVRYCEKYRQDTKLDEDFIKAPHMETLIYGIFDAGDTREDVGKPNREEGVAPQMKISTGDFVTSDTAVSPGKLNVENLTSTTDVLSRFVGFDHEDFYMIPDINKVELPTRAENYITVDSDCTISTADREDLPPYSVTELVGMDYPVIQLWGRKYIFSDLYGRLWKVIA